jgi:SM-20-related protein
MIDMIEIKDFLDNTACEDLLAELRAAVGGPATVLSSSPAGRVMPWVRNVTRVAVSTGTRERVKQLLSERMGALERYFGLALSACEEPQFLRYQTGDFFVAHQDGNTPMIHDSSRFRKVSAVVFLNAQSQDPAPGTYSGGSFVFHGPYSGPTLRIPLAPEPGTLLCFRAETTHEVLPVTEGERFTIASWYRSTEGGIPAEGLSGGGG